MNEIAEAIRFAEEYGYNKWQLAAEQHRFLEAEVEQLTKERDEAWRVAAEQTRLERDRAETAQAENQRLREALDLALTYVHCCGYRAEETTHPHVTGCPLGDRMAALSTQEEG